MFSLSERRLGVKHFLGFFWRDGKIAGRRAAQRKKNDERESSAF
jgi:hypothetical protein